MTEQFKIRQVSSGKEIALLKGHEKPVVSVAFGPDDTFLRNNFAGSVDPSMGRIAPATGRCTADWPDRSGVLQS